MDFKVLPREKRARQMGEFNRCSVKNVFCFDAPIAIFITISYTLFGSNNFVQSTTTDLVLSIVPSKYRQPVVMCVHNTVVIWQLEETLLSVVKVIVRKIRFSLLCYSNVKR